MKNKIGVFVLTFLAAFSIHAQIKIGLLNLDESVANKKEINALSSFFENEKQLKIVNVNEKQILETSSYLNAFNIFWIHSADSVEIETLTKNDSLIKEIKKYVNLGGNLLLTLDALRLVVPLGLESKNPTSQMVDANDDGYGRRLGLHSFLSHPVFEGMNGGAYIFNPTKDMKTKQVGYFNTVIPRGKVVAVDWSYITLKENSKLLLEYKVGKGSVLAVGAYTFFSIPNNSHSHLKLFVKNCINYLADESKFKNSKKQYWDYSTNSVYEFQSSHSFNKFSSTKNWRGDKSIELAKEKAGDNYWNVAFRRILVMGKEKSGIEEIWAHPFMALRDYEVGLRLKGEDTTRWLKNYSPSIIVSPEKITRSYKLKNISFTEIISAAFNEPKAIIHYTYDGQDSAELVIKLTSNMRLMWPYSEQTAFNIGYSINKSKDAFHFINKYNYSTLAGSNRKFKDAVIGKFDDFKEVNKKFVGIETEKFQASALAVYSLQKKDFIDFVIHASTTNAKPQTKNPQDIFAEANKYANRVINNSLTITTPDENFNEGYKWALIGTDKFYVETPGLGKSLVAGYSTTARGWGGGHKVNGRPGYAWYFGRDACWSSMALLDYGDFEKVKSVLEFLSKYQDINGKIFHELTTSGAVHYDASDATPLYLILCGKYLRHSGDVKFIKQIWPNIKHALEFCYSTDTDKDHLIENTNVGHGWVEGGGLYTAHTEVYLAACWSVALTEAAYICNTIGLTDESNKYLSEGKKVKEIINKNFWNNSSDFLSFSKLKDGSYNSEKSILASVPVYFEMLDSEKSKKVVNAYADNYFSADWGVRILREDSPIYNPKGYHTGSVWPLFTGWSALAEYKYGNEIQGFTHVMNNLLVYKNWQLGFVEEVLNGAEYKPSGVCPQQCWSETMVLQPAIEGMLGLNVDALSNSLKLSPKFPADWNSVNVERISIGKTLVNMSVNKKDGKTIYAFNSNSKKKIHIELGIDVLPGASVQSIVVNGNTIDPSKFVNGQILFDLNGKGIIEISHSRGISVLPNVVLPKPNDVSKGFRILSDNFDDKVYSIQVQGLNSSNNELKIYSDGMKIKSVENGSITSFENSIYTIKVSIPAESSKYVNRTVKVNVE